MLQPSTCTQQRTLALTMLKHRPPTKHRPILQILLKKQGPYSGCIGKPLDLNRLCLLCPALNLYVAELPGLCVYGVITYLQLTPQRTEGRAPSMSPCPLFELLLLAYHGPFWAHVIYCGLVGSGPNGSYTKFGTLVKTTK